MVWEKFTTESITSTYKIETIEGFSQRRCLIAGLFSMKEKTIEEHFSKVKLIVESKGGIVVGKLFQRRGISRAKTSCGMKKLNLPLSVATFLGKGKTEELILLSKKTEAEIIIFLNKLSETQKQNLSTKTGCKLIECVIEKS
jgi:50S ribosomal subunit-associated GTPase HflX